jgi:protein tyrosine phosphatase (PTP) superfamily phosphohydrolase (DUF442 family)
MNETATSTRAAQAEAAPTTDRREQPTGLGLEVEARLMQIRPGDSVALAGLLTAYPNAAPRILAAAASRLGNSMVQHAIAIAQRSPASGSPPAATAGPATADNASSTSGQASQTGFSMGGALKTIGGEAEVLGGEAVGIAELAGFRYSVKHYMAQVDGGLYRGSRIEDANGMAALKQMGIKGVVNLCLENNDDAPRAAAVGLNALHLPILDNSPPTVAQMQQFVDFARANPPSYVHCEAGKGRTGTAVACYRIAVDGWTAEQAIDEAKSYGLSLINQIAFIRRFAEVQSGPQGTVPANAASTPSAE